MFAVVLFVKPRNSRTPSFEYFAGVVGALVLKPGGQDERSALGSIETCSAADPYRRKTA